MRGRQAGDNALARDWEALTEIVEGATQLHEYYK